MIEMHHEYAVVHIGESLPGCNRGREKERQFRKTAQSREPAVRTHRHRAENSSYESRTGADQWAIRVLIRTIASRRVSRSAAYEMRSQPGARNAEPGVTATSPL